MARSLFIESCRASQFGGILQNEIASVQEIVDNKEAFNSPEDVDKRTRITARCALHRNYRWILERGDWDLVRPEVVDTLSAIRKARRFMVFGDGMDVLSVGAISLVSREYGEHDWRKAKPDDNRVKLLEMLENLNRWQPSAPMEGLYGHQSNQGRDLLVKSISILARNYGLTLDTWRGDDHTEVWLENKRGQKFKTADWEKFRDL